MFYLYNDELSAYPGEKEVLLQDGLQYLVVSVTKQIEVIEVNKKEYRKMVNVVQLKKVENQYTRVNKCVRTLKLLIK